MRLKLTLLLGALSGDTIYRIVSSTGKQVTVKDVADSNVLEITTHNDVLIITVDKEG